jgi:hypothetical protein
MTSKFDPDKFEKQIRLGLACKILKEQGLRQCTIAWMLNIHPWKVSRALDCIYRLTAGCKRRNVQRASMWRDVIHKFASEIE